MSQRALIDNHDGVLFDLDGVLYAGEHAIDGAVEAVERLKVDGLPCAYVTNNASRSAQTVSDHLNSLGIPAHATEVFGSVPVAVDLMSRELRPGVRVLVTGSDYLRTEVAQAGYTVVGSASERPAAVIQGFDPDLSWRELAEASYAINDGARWFATNLDLTIPRDRGIAPGNGALVEAISRATGTIPTAAGKPEPIMFSRAAQMLGMQAPLVVGDRLDTDILGGNRAQFTTALVLTGIDTAEAAAAAEQAYRPDYILTGLHDLFTPDIPGEPS